jgi:hypothetical protein
MSDRHDAIHRQNLHFRALWVFPPSFVSTDIEITEERQMCRMRPLHNSASVALRMAFGFGCSVGHEVNFVRGDMILSEVFQNLPHINSISPLRKMTSWLDLSGSSSSNPLAEPT